MDLLDRQWFLLNALVAYEADFDRLMLAGAYESRRELAKDFAELKSAGYLEEAWFGVHDDRNMVAAIITSDGYDALTKWRAEKVEEWVSASSYSD